MLHHREITQLLLVAEEARYQELPLPPLQEDLIIVIEFHTSVVSSSKSLPQSKLS